MRIVVAIHGGPAGERFESILRARGFDAVRFDEPLTKRDVHRAGGDVYICGDRKTLRTVLLAGLRPRPHLIGALQKLDDKSVSAMEKSGALDFICTAAGGEELVARVTMLQRLEEVRGVENVGRLRKLDAWARASQTVTMRFGEIIEKPVSVGKHDGKDPQVVARIRLTCREDGSTIDLVVGCAGSCGRAVINMLLPGAKPNLDALRDCLRELANNLAGSLKQAILSEGVSVTLGLPSDTDAEAYLSSDETWTINVDSATLVVGMIGGRGGAQMVPVRELEPDMVLRHDVLNEAGVPFVRSGTALTDRTIARLKEVLGNDFAVSVAEGRLSYGADSELGRDGVMLFGDTG